MSFVNFLYWNLMHACFKVHFTVTIKLESDPITPVFNMCLTHQAVTFFVYRHSGINVEVVSVNWLWAAICLHSSSHLKLAKETRHMSPGNGTTLHSAAITVEQEAVHSIFGKVFVGDCVRFAAKAPQINLFSTVLADWSHSRVKTGICASLSCLWVFDAECNKPSSYRRPTQIYAFITALWYCQVVHLEFLVVHRELHKSLIKRSWSENCYLFTVQ